MKKKQTKGQKAEVFSIKRLQQKTIINTKIKEKETDKATGMKHDRKRQVTRNERQQERLTTKN